MRAWLAGALLAAWCVGAADLVRSEHYLPVKDVKEASAESHYVVATYLLAQGALGVDERKALEQGQRRAEELILQKWAQAHLKPFVFVNYSPQRRDLYILDKVSWDEAPGKRVADAVAMLAGGVPVRADLPTCYSFDWVRGLKSASFTGWVNNPENQGTPQWISDRMGSISRQLQAKLDARFRLVDRTVAAYDQTIQDGDDYERKAMTAYRKYTYLLASAGQFGGDQLRQLEARLPAAANEVVELAIKRFGSTEYSAAEELERAISLFGGTLATWQRDPRLKAIADGRADELTAAQNKMQASRGSLWEEEFVRLTENLDFMEMLRRMRSRMIELETMPEAIRGSMTETLWGAYDGALPEAAYYWETMCDKQIARGGRSGLSYLVIDELRSLVTAHTIYRREMGPGAEAAEETLADLEKKYTELCRLRNQCVVVVDLPDAEAAAFEKALREMVEVSPWVAEPLVLRSGDGPASRTWRVVDNGGVLTILHGGSSQAHSDGAVAAAKALTAAMAAYPLRLAEQIDAAGDPSIVLNFRGYLRAALAQLDLDRAGDNPPPVVAQLLELRKSSAASTDKSLHEWMENQRQSDLVEQKASKGGNSSLESLFE